MQIQQVLAVSTDHTEQHHQEAATRFELGHERRHLAARRPALAGSLRECELLRLSLPQLPLKQGTDQVLPKPSDNSPS